MQIKMKWFFSVLLCLPMLFTADCLAATPEEAQEISEFVEEFVTDELLENNPNLKLEITVPDLTRRQRIAGCAGELTAELIKKDYSRRSNSVKVQCEDGESSWNAVIPVRIKFTTPAVTVKSAVSKDQILTPDNLEISYVDNLTLRGNYFTDTTLVAGSKSKRELSAGSIIKNNQICMVCKDDIVDLEAGTNEVTIKVQGKALEDGALNRVIKVENLISHKEVRAKVIGVGLVRIDVK